VVDGTPAQLSGVVFMSSRSPPARDLHHDDPLLPTHEAGRARSEP